MPMHIKANEDRHWVAICAHFLAAVPLVVCKFHLICCFIRLDFDSKCSAGILQVISPEPCHSRNQK